MNTRKWMIVAGAALALLAAAMWTTSAFAQGGVPGMGMMQGGVPGTGMMQGAGMMYGRGPGMGMAGHGSSLVAVAASKLGMTETELIAALGSDKTVAALAQERGVELSTIVDAFVAQHSARMDAMVASGAITREIADQRLAQMRANVTARLSEPGLGSGYADANGDGVCDHAGSMPAGGGRGRPAR